jgi:hypothetical protein
MSLPKKPGKYGPFEHSSGETPCLHGLTSGNEKLRENTVEFERGPDRTGPKTVVYRFSKRHSDKPARVSTSASVLPRRAARSCVLERFPQRKRHCHGRPACPSLPLSPEGREAARSSSQPGGPGCHRKRRGVRADVWASLFFLPGGRGDCPLSSQPARGPGALRRADARLSRCQVDRSEQRKRRGWQPASDGSWRGPHPGVDVADGEGPIATDGLRLPSDFICRERHGEQLGQAGGINRRIGRVHGRGSFRGEGGRAFLPLPPGSRVVHR